MKCRDNPCVVVLFMNCEEAARRRGRRAGEAPAVPGLENKEKIMSGRNLKMAVLALVMSIAGFANAGIKKNSDENTLWIETFQDSSSIAKWRNNGGFTLKAENNLLVADPREATKKKDYTIGRYVPFDKAYPYLQVNLESVDQLKGYKGWTLSSASTDNHGFFCNLAGGVIPGIWTFKVDDCLKLAKDKGEFFLRVDMHGYVFKYKSLKMMKEPLNAIIATSDKKILKDGDIITFKLLLKSPCKDASVNIRKSYCLVPLKKINDNGYVQMTSDDKGKTWNGSLKITKKGFGDKKLKQGQLIFQCNMLGGKLRKVFTSSSFGIDCGN